jgi:hypothetical protein
MLTVIKDEQHLLPTQIITEHVDNWTLWLIMETNCHRDGTREKQGICNRSKFHEPHAMGISSQYLPQFLEINVFSQRIQNQSL